MSTPGRPKGEYRRAQPEGTPVSNDNIQQLGQGFYWQDLVVGQQFRTHRRTITEADLVGFIGVTGMLEKIFIDATPMPGGEQRMVGTTILCTALLCSLHARNRKLLWFFGSLLLANRDGPCMSRVVIYSGICRVRPHTLSA